MKGQSRSRGSHDRKRARKSDSSQTDSVTLESLGASKLPRKRPQVALWKQTYSGGDWLITGGVLPEGKLVGCASIKKQFRWFTLGAVLYAWTEEQTGETLPFEAAEELIMCVAVALTEETGENSRRRFSVYRSIAGLLGYRERTQLPPVLEWAVKMEFPDIEAQYVGFQADV